MPPDQSQRAVIRYGIAVLSVAGAVGLTRVLAGIGDSGISPQFFAAVLLSAWYGGLGPGLLATALSGVAAGYLLMAPHPNSFTAIREDCLRVAVFTAVAVLTNSLHAASRKARDAAESASAAKSRFLAMVSHELRTPLGPVIMATDMLLDDPSLPDRMVKDLRTIRRNIDLEIRLINDLLDLTRISAGKLGLSTEPVDAHPLLMAAAEVCRNDAAAKRIAFHVSPNASQSLVLGDEVRLQQVFWNLLRNAIKFTPEGGSVAVGTRNDDAGDFVVTVADNGIGIDPTRLSAIFVAFEQADPDVAARFGGLGLGLAICKALVDAHGGTIAAGSDGHGRGSQFTVRLPLIRLPEASSELIAGGDGAMVVARTGSRP